ncbi:2OG-Fe dioxygenase family protein [Aliivibrio fischeri]|uniref:Agglutination protein n=1 Tax=Aliivibrio fischeri TaxID=668 RepID=A0A510UFC1_ALIFS|nr:2OG-Fe dioxygenase family protein [Aliivibrio fischeri]MUK69046.1 agglutination protein [Aliivibrio fischeri]MUK71919.1 agglutination protein [Aliivibrio fischeri]GEK12150.1 agglutination protein [Aliivibrio fischeri]
MYHSHEMSLQLTHLSHDAVHQLAPSFSGLPKTTHADGNYRLRRYSVIRIVNEKIIETNKHNFVQSEDINHFQGDVLREFEAIESSILHSDGMLEMCQIFMDLNDLPNGQEIEIHQMRIAAIYDETEIAPEGVHQDGFDHIAIIGIDRSNIDGGELLVYENSDEAPFFKKILADGDVALVDDRKLWHNGKPIRLIDQQKEGHMDVFVLTAKDNIDEFHS